MTGICRNVLEKAWRCAGRRCCLRPSPGRSTTGRWGLSSQSMEPEAWPETGGTGRTGRLSPRPAAGLHLCQQQLSPQPSLHPQPPLQPPPTVPPLPQQQHTRMRIRMIQRQLLPPQPLLPKHISAHLTLSGGRRWPLAPTDPSYAPDRRSVQGGVGLPGDGSGRSGVDGPGVGKHS